GRSTPAITHALWSSPLHSGRSPWPDLNPTSIRIRSGAQLTTLVLAPTTIRRSQGPSLLSEGDLPPEQHFIERQFRPGSSGQFIDVVDPCNGSVFARVAQGTAGDVDIAVAAARAAQPRWGALTPKER